MSSASSRQREDGRFEHVQSVGAEDEVAEHKEQVDMKRKEFLMAGTDLVGSVTVSKGSRKSRKLDTADHAAANGEEIVHACQTVAVRKPDGRKCNCCPRRDSDWDPTALAKGIQEYMYWGYPTKDDGTTAGNHCGYCTKYYAARVKHRGITMKEWELSLGADQQRLNLHLENIRQVIQVYIDKGYKRTAHVSWDQVEKKSLTLVTSMEALIKRPGWKFLPWDFYVSKHGDLATNGKTNDGHREFHMDGKRGVLIPDEPIVSIEFNERIAAQIEQQIETSDDPQFSKDQMETKMKEMSARFFNSASGSFPGALASSDPGSSSTSLPAISPLPPASSPAPKPVGSAGIASLSSPFASSTPSPLAATAPQDARVAAQPKAKGSGKPKAKAKGSKVFLFSKRV